MQTDLLYVLGLLVMAIVMFAMNRPRMDVVALLVMTALPFTGAVTMAEALAGFSDSNIVLIAALFVIGESLVRTGVARKLGDLLAAFAGSSQTRLVVMLMISVCGLGAMMSSTAVTAIFIPVVLRIAQRMGAAPGRLMMPLSVAALISGMTTLVATAPNMVVSSELVRQGHAGFSFFSFTPFGVPVLLIGIVYMLVARKWLPGEDATAAIAGGPGTPKQTTMAGWIESYKLASREHRLRICPGSPLEGRAIADISLGACPNAMVVAIERPTKFSREVFSPGQISTVMAGDILLIDLAGPDTGFADWVAGNGLEAMPLAGAYFSDRAQEIGMAELMVPADSDLIGKTIGQTRFRTRTGLTIIGMRHGAIATERPLLTESIKMGDTLLVIGPWGDIERLQPDDAGVVVLRIASESTQILPVPGKAAIAVGCLLLVVGLMVSGIVPNVQAALIGCLLLGVFRCIDMPSAYRAIDWKTLVLIVGMLPFSLALQRTGGVDLAADALMRVTSGAGTTVILACLFLITCGLGLFISNTATAVLMAPVALAVAKDLGASPYPLAMIVALAASTAFVTPVSSPVNTLVVGPGNYTFGQFVKVGGPLALIVMIVTVLMVPRLLPLYPNGVPATKTALRSNP